MVPCLSARFDDGRLGLPMKNLIKFLFKGELHDRAFRYGRMKVSREPGQPSQQTDKAGEENKFKLVLVLSWALVILLFVCVTGVFALLLTDRDVPNVFYLTISGIVGYFGGAISAYLGIQKTTR